ncbi:MAG TPA: 30S ribosomal protein S27e [archaeon]|nr:30S ribosomal protein S27e [archaeon]
MKTIESMIPTPKTKFLKVKCGACGSEQTIFSAAASKVKCLACSLPLAEPSASKAELKAKVLKEFG